MHGQSGSGRSQDGLAEVQEHAVVIDELIALVERSAPGHWQPRSSGPSLARAYGPRAEEPSTRVYRGRSLSKNTVPEEDTGGVPNSAMEFAGASGRFCRLENVKPRNPSADSADSA